MIDIDEELKLTEETKYIDQTDVQITQLFNHLEQTSSTEAYRELCLLLSKKLIVERRNRLKAEAQAREMMDQEDKTISNLQEKLTQFDARSAMSLRDSPRQDRHIYEEEIS
jgi:hypothetical protein